MSVVFSVYFVDFIRSGVQHISRGDVACCIARAISINTIVAQSSNILSVLCNLYIFSRFSLGSV